MTQERRDLENDLADILPDTHPELRKSSLTRDDILLVASVFQRITPAATCSIGISPDLALILKSMTPEELGILKRFAQAGIKMFALLGILVFTGIVGVLSAIFGKGFWAWIGGR